VLTHLAALATRGDAEARYAEKLKLTRRLYERGLSKQLILELYRFIDWVLRLPEALELKYTDTIYQIEESKNMPYLSFVERRGEARGFGVMLRGQLAQRFGPLSDAVIARLDAADVDQLLAWSRRVLDARTLDDVFADDA